MENKKLKKENEQLKVSIKALKEEVKAKESKVEFELSKLKAENSNLKNKLSSVLKILHSDELFSDGQSTSTNSISLTQVSLGSSFQQSASKTNNKSEVKVLSKKFSFVTSLIREELTESTASSSSENEEFIENYQEAKAIVVTDEYRGNNVYQFLLDDKKWVKVNRFTRSVRKICGVFEISNTFYVVSNKGISTLNNEFYEFSSHSSDYYYTWHQSYRVGNKILIFRTRHELQLQSNKFNLFDSINKQFIDVDIKAKRMFFDAVYYLNQLWIIGGSGPVKGKEDHAVFNTIQIYDLVSKTTSLSPVKMIQARYGHKAIVYENKLFVFSGFLKDDYLLNTVEMYSPNTKKFVRMAPMKTGRRHFACNRVGNLVYVIAGDICHLDEADSVEIYNLDTNTWTVGKDLPDHFNSKVLYACPVNNKLE